MEFFNKMGDALTNLAATATEKAGSAIESGKLALKISGEEKKISEATMRLGEIFLARLDACQGFDEEVMEVYDQIRAARETITEIRSQQKDDEIVITEEGVCPTCGQANEPGTRFCCQCGAKLEEAATVVDAPKVCPACGAEAKTDGNFCSECGTKL